MRLVERFTFTLLLLAGSNASAQDYYQAHKDSTKTKRPAPVTCLGIGLGVDYGGLGAQFDYAVHPNFVFILGLGYNFLGPGVNGGFEGRANMGGRGRPFLGAIYGYNAVIVIKGASEYNQVYYGPSFGGGVEVRKRRNENYWRYALWVPVRSQEFYDDMDRIRKNPTIELYSEPGAFTISVGYHFGN